MLSKLMVSIPSISAIKFKKQIIIHKQIGTLYMMLGGFSGVVGLGLSIIIRMELAQSGNSFKTPIKCIFFFFMRM